MPSAQSRLITKVRYRKPNKAGHGVTARYAKYIGTREGAVMMPTDGDNVPATKAQKKMIKNILTDIPAAKKSVAYHEYQRNMTSASASEFIDDTLDNFGHEMIGLSKYAEYMATRPLAEKMPNSGLFSDSDREVKLENVEKELSECQGNVYLPIISLRGEDSVKFGYDNPKAWQALIERHRDDFSRWFKIPPENLRWVAAYHHAINGEGQVHNHIHMIIWSTNKNDGWIKQPAIQDMHDTLAKDIFSQELNVIYAQKTQTRDEAREEARQKVHEIALDIQQNPASPDGVLCMEMTVLSNKLKDHKGRKFYQYLSRENKQIVDNIVDRLPDADPRLKELLDVWADAKDRQIKVYSDGSYVMPPLSQIKEFKTIKNDTIMAAYEISKSQAQGDVEGAVNPDGDALLQKYATQQVVNALTRLTGDLARQAEHSSGYGRNKARGHQYQQMSQEDLQHMYGSQIKM